MLVPLRRHLLAAQRRAPSSRAARRRRSRAPPAAGAPAPAARRPRAGTRRARAPPPPPVKNDCSVCAASWITRSPSIRPGQPRSRASSFGVNMQSFTAGARGLTVLGVDDHVRRSPGSSRRIRSSISLARACASASGSCRVEPERQEHDEPVVRLRGSAARAGAPVSLADDRARRLRVARDVGAAGAPALRLLGQRLEVRLHGVDARQRLDDRLLDLARRPRAPPPATGRPAASGAARPPCARRRGGR